MNEQELQRVNFEQAKRLNAAGFDWRSDKISWRDGIGTNIPTVALAIQFIEKEKGLLGYVAYDFLKRQWYFVTEDEVSELYATRNDAGRALLDELLTLIEKEKN